MRLLPREHESTSDAVGAVPQSMNTWEGEPSIARLLLEEVPHRVMR